MRLLLIEDEAKLAEGLSRNLKAEGFAVDIAGDGVIGLELAATYTYDLILLDLLLPKLDGTQVLQRIRARNREVPILVLTARDAIQDKIIHFEDGADDYLTKPYSFGAFLVRIKALLRRKPAQALDVIRIGDFELERLSHRVRRGDKRIELSAKEYALLEYLAVNAGRILSRSMIIKHVWDQSFENLTNIVDVYIRQLRAKLDDDDYPVKLIRTVPGADYVFDDGAGA